MFTLDQMLEGLAVEVMPFALCEARGGAMLDLGERRHATMHYVIGGAGMFDIAGWPGVVAEAGTILITPPSSRERLWDCRRADCGALSCAPLDPGWQLHSRGIGQSGIIVACGEISASYHGISNLFDHLQEPLVIHLARAQGMASVLDQILDETAAPKPGSRTLVRLLMQQCVIQIIREYGDISHSPLAWLAAVRDEKLWRAVEAMMQEPRAPHTLDSLAALAHMSRSSFADRFKSVFDRGPIDFLKHLRLQQAARMLRTTDLSIKAISRNIGYNSRSYFSRAFHDAYGVSPVEFRSGHRDPPLIA